ncbi:MAG: DMT family transporter, partial [Methylocystaceae bacterium]|nr:DMT family transporter [Methylocystaceae bacterium]
GAAVAFAGETFLVLSKSDPSQHATFEGDVLILLSILCVSVGYVCGGRLSTLIGTWAATSWSLAISGILFIPLFIFLTLNVEITTITQASWGGVAYLVIFTCILGYACWYWAIGQLGVGAIAPLQFGLPLVSVTLGVIIFNEALTFQIFVAAITILTGIAITRKA